MNDLAKNDATVKNDAAKKFMSGGAIQPKTVSSGGVPAGRYKGTFIGIEYLAATPPDPMTGKCKRQYDAVRFNWRISEGEYAGKLVSRECPPNATSRKSKLISTVEMLTGQDPSNGWTLDPCIGQQYTVQIGNKINQQGVASNWLEVINCM